MQNPKATLVHTIPKHSIGGANSSYVFDIKEARLQTGNMIVLNSKSIHPDFGHTINETVTVLEYTPHKSSHDSGSDSWFDFSNFKMPA